VYGLLNEISQKVKRREFNSLRSGGGVLASRGLPKDFQVSEEPKTAKNGALRTPEVTKYQGFPMFSVLGKPLKNGALRAPGMLKY